MTCRWPRPALGSRIANPRTPEREDRLRQVKLEKPQRSRVGLFTTRRVIVMKEGSAQLQAPECHCCCSAISKWKVCAGSLRNFSRISAVKKVKKCGIFSFFHSAELNPMRLLKVPFNKCQVDFTSDF